MIAALGSAWVWRFGWPGKGALMVLRPIGASSALIVRGTGTDATLYRVNDGGLPVWRARARDFSAPFLPWGGLAVGADRVVFATDGGDSATMRAVSLVDGGALWEGADRSLDLGEAPTDRAVFAAVTPDVFVMFTGAGRIRMLGLDAATGVTRWRRDLHGTPDRAWVRGHNVIVSGALNGESYRFDAREGRLGSLHAASPCVGAERVVYQAVDRIVTDRIVGGDTHGRKVGDLFWLQGACADRGGATLALAGGIDRTSIVAYGADLGPLWQLDLRGLRPVRQGQVAYPDLHPLSGTAARFIPLLLANRATGALTIVVVDVDERREAWRTPEGPALGGFGVYEVDGITYVMDTARIATIDGATGELLGAVRLNGAIPIQPYHVADGKVWFGAPNGQIGTLDGRTLIPDRNVRSVIVNDARDEFAVILGISEPE